MTISRQFLVVSVVLLVLILVEACSNYDETPIYGTDKAIIQKGNKLFDNNCVACHNFKTSGIGPSLGGITAKVSPEWLKSFIRNPAAMIDGGDQRAVGLFERYGQYMPPYAMLTEEELDAILAYLHTKKARKAQAPKTNWGPPIDNPIESKIPNAPIALVIEEYTQLPFTQESGQRARVNKIEPIGHGNNRLFAHDLRGKLYEVVNQKPHLFLDLAALKVHFIHVPGHGTGLGSFAFHPDYDKNGLFYTTHTENPSTSKKADFGYDDQYPVKVRWVLTEWKQNDPTAMTFEGDHRELFRMDMVTQIHGVQEIKFNPLAKIGDEDYGLLYIGVGDGGSVGQRWPFFCRKK